MGDVLVDWMEEMGREVIWDREREGRRTGANNVCAVRGSKRHYVVEGLAFVSGENFEGGVVDFGHRFRVRRRHGR